MTYLPTEVVLSVLLPAFAFRSSQSALHEELKYMRENAVFASPNASQVSGIGTAYSDDSHAPILRHKGSSQTFVDSAKRSEW